MTDKIQDKFFAENKNFVQCGHRQLLHKILDGHEYLSDEQLVKALNEISEKKDFHTYVKDFFKQLPTKEDFSNGIKRKPTVLILDKEIQGLPWESMGFLQGHPLSRVPSFQFLSLLFKAHKNKKKPDPSQIR